MLVLKLDIDYLRTLANVIDTSERNEHNVILVSDALARQISKRLREISDNLSKIRFREEIPKRDKTI
jgi:hypothetical protein